MKSIAASPTNLSGFHHDDGHWLVRRVQFHYTPKHASWLNMAEIEIGILSRQCLNRRVPTRQCLQSEVKAWQRDRNAQRRTIEWKFTRQDADRKLERHYVPKRVC